MNAMPPILPAPAAATPPAQSAAAPSAIGATPPAGGAAPPAGANQHADRKDFSAALRAAEKEDRRRPRPHGAPTAADPALLGTQLPVSGNPPPALPIVAPPPSPPPIGGATAPAATAGLAAGLPAAKAAPGAAGAAQDARTRLADIAAKRAGPTSPAPGGDPVAPTPAEAGASSTAPSARSAAAAAGANMAQDAVIAAAASHGGAARGQPEVLEPGRGVGTEAAATHAREPLPAVAATQSTAAPPTSTLTPANPMTQAPPAPTPPSAALAAIQTIAAANPTADSFATAASAAATGGSKQKSASPGDGSASPSAAPAAAAASPGSESTRPLTAPVPPPRPAAVASGSAAAAQKLVHAANGASSSATPTDGAAGAAASLAASAAASGVRHHGGSEATFQLNTGINTPEFPQALADRVTWMVDHNLNGASLQLNPPHLGPIELRVSVERGHAAVWMSAQNATTLDALHSSAPKLREMLGTQGFGQVSVDISQRSFQDRSAYPRSPAWTAAPGGDSELAAAVATGSARGARLAHGVLDAYA